MLILLAYSWIMYEHLAKEVELLLDVTEKYLVSTYVKWLVIVQVRVDV